MNNNHKAFLKKNLQILFNNMLLLITTYQQCVFCYFFLFAQKCALCNSKDKITITITCPNNRSHVRWLHDGSLTAKNSSCIIFVIIAFFEFLKGKTGSAFSVLNWKKKMGRRKNILLVLNFKILEIFEKFYSVLKSKTC